MNLRAIRRAIFQARAGVKHDNSQAFPIKPIRSEMVNNGGVVVQNYSYIILLDSYQVNQLKSDKEFQDLQNTPELEGIKTPFLAALWELWIIARS